ncbi:MAG: YegS/Rv2252/BmrU family lipid kinase [Gemmatimonadota bacterium]|nr:YegS/Rv2252/BmrU family lipid kinase [Gemmatimonadota bacterium]
MPPVAVRKHLTYIVHGARADNAELRQMVSWVRQRGHAVDLRVTWDAGEGEWLTSQAADRGTDVVIACGGDGTLNEVVNGLDGRDVPLGVVPLGTANDFARQTGIPEVADHAMDVILRRKPVRIDTASMNGRRFLNVSTGGMGAEATAETPADFKASLGPLAYAITAIRKLADNQVRHASFSSAGFELDVDFLAFAVGSARVTGGGTMMTPDASVTDGLLDLCVIEAMSRRDFARLSLRIKDGEHVGLPGVHYAQLPWLKVTGTEPLSVNLDGEGLEAQVCDYRARRADLLVHVQHLPGEEGGA